MENNQKTQVLIEILNDCRAKVTIVEPNGKKESFERNYGSQKILERKIDSLKADMEKAGAEVKVEEVVVKNTASDDASELKDSVKPENSVSPGGSQDSNSDQAPENLNPLHPETGAEPGLVYPENSQQPSFDDDEDELFEAGFEAL